MMITIKNKILFSEILDLRKMKKTASMIENLDIDINNKDLFIEKMKDIGYYLLSNNFLVKKQNDKEINLTLDNDIIKSLSVYDENNNSLDIESFILDEVISDIKSCNL